MIKIVLIISPGKNHQLTHCPSSFEKTMSLSRFCQRKSATHVKLETTRCDETGQFGKGRTDEFRLIVKETSQIEALYRVVEG